MQKYYKVVAWIGLFRETYDIEEIDSITPGTRFVAKEPNRSEDVMLICNPPVLHFAKGELNTLLWYEFFEICSDKFFMTYRPPVCIYEIEPIGHISHGVCCDKNQLYQYGANIIEFKERIRVSQIVQKAIPEYKETNPDIHNKELANKIELWQKCMQNTESWFDYLNYERIHENWHS